jgi:outer membrane protein assembly factor BamB
MAREPQVLVYVGIKSSVLALDARTGDEVWRTPLRGSDFTTVLWDGEALFAANYGEVFRLDPRSGAVMWHNELKGLGRGLVSLSSARRAEPATDTELAAMKRLQDARAAAAS